MQFTAYFNRNRALVIALLSLLTLAYLFLISTSENKILQSTLPLVLLFYSFSQFRRKHLVFENGYLTIYANYGPLKKGHRFEKFSDFYIERQNLFLNKGPVKILITAQHVVQTEDWETLKTLITKPSPLTHHEE